MCPVPCGCGAHSACGVVVAALALTRSTDMIGWGLRFVNILSAGIYALYYYNARSSISLNRLLGGLATLWVTLIVLGYGGVLFPEFRLRTPMSFIMPAGFYARPCWCAIHASSPG